MDSEAQDHKQNPKATAYRPMRQCAGSGIRKEYIREHQREDAAQDKQPFTPDFLSEPDRSHNFKDARYECPDRDDHEQREGRPATMVKTGEGVEPISGREQDQHKIK